MEDSPLKSQAVKEGLAADYVRLGSLITAIAQRMAETGRVGKESQKAQNAAVGNRRRLLEALQVLSAKEENPLGELFTPSVNTISTAPVSTAPAAASEGTVDAEDLLK